jgi:hypothetical protein
MKRKRNADSPYARLDPFARGAIWGMYLAKATPEEILKHVVKKDGATPWHTAIDDVIKHKKDNPDWKGGCSDLVGRPPLLTDAQRKKVVSLVFKEHALFCNTLNVEKTSVVSHSTYIRRYSRR